MKTILVILSITLGLAVKSEAAPAWGKATWGMTRAQILAEYPEAHEDIVDGKPTQDIFVLENVEIRGKKFIATFYFNDLGKLVSTGLLSKDSFTEANAEAIIDDYLVKYGPALKNEKDPEYGHRKVLWNKEGLKIKVEYINSRHGMFTVSYEPAEPDNI